MTTEATPDAVHTLVRERYGAVAANAEAGSCCAPTCCSPEAATEETPGADARAVSQRLGYEAESLDAVPDAANLGLGCGNPTALASLQPGEVVVDLGSGGGLDALIAANAVGPTGRVIGVDMTPEMLSSARKNAVEMGVQGHVEFREGLIESLPIASDSVDVILSNCVINLSPDKPAVFREAYRVLKPGARLAVSDIVLTAELPPEITALPEAYVACVSGSSLESAYLGAMRDAGFVDIEYTRVRAASLLSLDQNDPMILEAIEAIGHEQVAKLADSVWSYKITARKA